MGTKNVFIRTVVNNSGIDINDVSIVILTVPTEVTKEEVVKVITDTNNRLREENDEGDCMYNEEGWNASTLMDTVCNKTGWTWGFLNPDLEVDI